jgi:hypothetical protein
MIKIVLGLVLCAAGVFGVIHFRARNGEPHWFVKRPGMSMGLLLALLVMMTLGAAMFVAGLVE